MKRCEREPELVRELHGGSLSAELIGHLRGCASCAETERVARAMLRSAAGMRVRLELPAAEEIWQRAQVRSQELALKRATQPLIFMRAVSFVCATISAVWLLHGLWGLLADYRQPMAGLTLMMTRAAAVGVGLILISIAVASWYLLHESRSGGVVPSA